MASNKSNKNVNNNAPTQANNSGLDKPVFVPEKDTNKQSVPPVKSKEWTDVQIEAFHALHRTMNTDARPMSLDDVVDFVCNNALLTQCNAKFIAPFEQKYKGYVDGCKVAKQTPLSKEAYTDDRISSKTREMMTQLRTTKVS